MSRRSREHLRRFHRSLLDQASYGHRTRLFCRRLQAQRPGRQGLSEKARQNLYSEPSAASDTPVDCGIVRAPPAHARCEIARSGLQRLSSPSRVRFGLHRVHRRHEAIRKFLLPKPRRCKTPRGDPRCEVTHFGEHSKTELLGSEALQVFLKASGGVHPRDKPVTGLQCETDNTQPRNTCLPSAGRRAGRQADNDSVAVAVIVVVVVVVIVVVVVLYVNVVVVVVVGFVVVVVVVVAVFVGCYRLLLMIAVAVAGAVAVVVVVGGAATDHRRQCSCANQARGANSRGSQQAPFLKHKGCPTD